MIQMTLRLLLSSITFALASFGPPVRVSQQNLPNHSCHNCAIAIGPGAPSSQPIYVVFEDDSTLFDRADIMFQKSTDAGRTWLPTDLLIARGAPGAFDPDITTDSDGNAYIVYQIWHPETAVVYDHRIMCVRSSDGGATWSAPARIDDDSIGGIGLIRIASDTAGNLFVAWNQFPGGLSRIFTSVSTDKGATWSPRVCVDDDTLTDESYHPEVFVQPGTNHYLVASTTYRWFENRPHIRPCAYLYRSTDMGRTFEPGVQLDTFNDYAAHPHVVADRDHIICDYFGDGWEVRDTIVAEARTFYTQADSWGIPTRVTSLDSLQELYLSGTLALSSDGRVHTALMVDDTALGYDIYYASSSDHGVSWSDIEPVYTDSARSNWYPDIGADSTGHAYVVWYSPSVQSGQVWFSTNAPLGIAEETSNAELRTPNSSPTVVRGVLVLGGNGDSPSEREDARYSPHFPAMSCAALLDISGRQVTVLKPGANDVRALAPGIYFVRSEPAAVSRQPSAVTKVVVTR
jgi:hypothetical protein